MKETNIKKLAELINLSITEGRMAYDIQNPLYQSLYFDIFFDELKTNDPSSYEVFSDQLVTHIDTNEPNAEEAIESFMTVWSAWVNLYDELRERNMLRLEQDVIEK